MIILKALAVLTVASLQNGGLVTAQMSYTPASYSCANTNVSNADTSNGSNSTVIYSLDYFCDSMLPPSSWQKKENDTDNYDYDLVIIGGGIGGAYVANRLLEEFEKKGQDPPKIALFERASTVGGRLMSAYGSGALGLSVQPRTPDMTPETLQEYGGMRVDPYRYPLIFNKILQEGQALFGKDKCLTLYDCAFGTNCCPDMLIRMEVGAIRYATTRTDLGVLSNASVFDQSQSYNVTDDGTVVSSYALQNIANGTGSPYDKCAQLVLAVDAYHAKTDPATKSLLLLKTAIDDLCQNCNASGIAGMCALCAQFPKPAEAMLSCSGYDQDPDKATLAGFVHFFDEVVNMKRDTFLYVFRAGFQRFVMGILSGEPNYDRGISPFLQKTLVEVAVQGDPNATQAFAKNQTESLSALAQHSTVPTEQRIITRFSDGSSASSKAVYMGMLPYDLPGIKGFEAWQVPLATATSPIQATKIVLGWNNASKALPAMLKMQPCVPGPCQRLILDGDHEKGWVTRQVWNWNNNTILIYGVGAQNTANLTYPVQSMVDVASKSGMDVLVSTIMEQIRNATKVAVEDPDWARFKAWPLGTFTAWNAQAQNDTYGTNPEKFSAHISRPLGYNVPVYYGNSEVASDGNNHGWAEGALEMVEDNLQSLATYLGLVGRIESPSRVKMNVTQAREEWEIAQAAIPSTLMPMTNHTSASGGLTVLGSTAFVACVLYVLY
jgi:hypothetical protein